MLKPLRFSLLDATAAHIYVLVLRTAEKVLNVPFSIFSSPVQEGKKQSFISNAVSEYFDSKAGNAQAP